MIKIIVIFVNKTTIMNVYLNKRSCDQIRSDFLRAL